MRMDVCPRQTGFYVYYEKNEPMHNFLIARTQKMEKKTEEVDDSAVRNFRKKVEKNAGQEQKKSGFPVMKAAGICAAVAVLAVGVLYLTITRNCKAPEKSLQILIRRDKLQEYKRLHR